jgi:hypothetical protein
MALWLYALRCSEFLSASRATEPRAILNIKATDDPGNLLVASFIGSPAMNFLIGRAQFENNALCVIRKRHMIGALRAGTGIDNPRGHGRDIGF